MKLTSGDGKQDEVQMLMRGQLQSMVAAEFKSRASSSSGGKAEYQHPAVNTGGGGDKKPKQKKKKKTLVEKRSLG